MSFFNDIFGFNDEDDLKKGYQNANDIISNAQKNMKSASQLYNEGRGVAGQAAADKAGQAKKSAIGASKMAGASKLQQAIQGSAAASDASTKGYSETASNAAAMEQSNEQAKLAAANAQAANVRAAAEAEQNRRDSKRNRLAQFGGAMASAFSDKNSKSFKRHEYIKKENR